MNIIVSLREILHNGDWDLYCKDTGLNPWCINEGADGDEKVELTVDQAHKYRLIKED